MLANKRKYHLESKKEKSAVLEQERKSLNEELDWLRSDNDYLKRQIEAMNQEKASGLESSGDEGPRSPSAEARPSEKDRVERVGVCFGSQNYELDQSANRIKQLESVLATPVTNMSEEINWLKEEVRKLGEERAKSDWKLGEVTQYWNDAKWRIGELEGELSHVKHSLEEAQRRNSELENHSELRREIDNLRQEKGHLEWRTTELNQAYNDAKWRIGELEAEVGRKSDHIQYLESGGGDQRNFEEERRNLHRQLDELRDQKSKVEWRLGEVKQFWNDSKWRINELEECVKQKDSQLRDASFKAQQMAESRPQSNSNISERVLTQLSNGSFIISKQPHGDRHRWNMVTWDNLVCQNADLRRVWFEVNAEGANEVFLIGSFVSWECALLCTPLPDDASRRGVWIDLPPGRHQFRFIRDGSWFTASEYSQENNEFGGTNNWLSVE
uniref:AMP-activated protein kinase glycogen-binding domain-containing protein n=1 Tax=Ditylenchus dipsaci TaxID=166011 RepID=A0A915ECC3_9BILA